MSSKTCFQCSMFSKVRYDPLCPIWPAHNLQCKLIPETMFVMTQEGIRSIRFDFQTFVYMSKLENTTTPSTSYVPMKMHLCWRHSIHVNSKSNDCAQPTLLPTLPGQVGALPLGRRVVIDLFYFVLTTFLQITTLHLSMQEFQSLKTLYRHIQYSESQNTCKLFLSKMGIFGVAHRNNCFV
jgi:hypothetical protein